MAQRCDQRVEVLSLRSETAQTFAKPAGGFTREQSVEPRFARRADGSWTRIDTTLRVTGTTITPAAAALPVEFSAGGTGPAAKLRDGDRELSITWPFGPLPKPVLSGADATYPEVLPGVDLRLSASSQGFSEVLVVKNREAAKNPKLAKVKFGFDTKGVTAHARGGGLEAEDAAGKVVFTSPPPTMWDSGEEDVAHVGVLSKSAAEGRKKRKATMPVTAANGELTVTPDAALLDAAQYPVMIDPSWTGTVQGNAWTLVSSKDAGSAFWQGRNNQGSDYLFNSGTYGSAGTGLTCDNVSQTGTCLSQTYNVRSYFRMDLSAVKGKVVTGASFRIEQKWSFTCSPNSNATVRVTNGFDGGTTWNNQPGWWDDNWAWSSAANRKVGAVHGCAGPGDVEFNFSGVVAHGARENWDSVSVVLHVGEGAVSSWKRFNPGSAVLAIDYNSYPNTPDAITVDGKACATGDGRPAVPTATPTIRGRVSDPDGADTMKGRFEWRRIRPNGTQGPIAHLDNSPWGNGTTAEQTIPKSDNTVPTGVVEWSDDLVGTGDWDNDGKSDLIYRDHDGYLYLMPTVETPAGWRSGDRVQIGTGWSGYTIAGLADWDKDGKTDIIAREDGTGRLLLYPGEGKRGPSAIPPVPIGGGWGGFTYAGVADYDRDGKQDVIARDPGNTLWLYPGDGNRAQPTAERVSLGGGWDNFTYYGVVDRTGDGAPDIIAEWGDILWLYKGLGARTPQTGNYVRWQIGAGWQGATARTVVDFNSDGAPDIVAKVRWTDSWYLYPGVIGTTNGGDPWVIAARGITTGNYAYRMTAGDHSLWGPSSNWCEFSVDVAPPEAPAFKSSVYKTSGCASEGCGGLGIADTFEFTSGSSDVDKFRWGFTDMPSETVKAGETVRWTPPAEGPHTLFVDAVDKAGLATRSRFSFTVAGAKRNEAEWFAADDPSSDGTGNGHDLTLTGLDPAKAGRTVGGPQSVGFPGTTANGATTAKVLDTSKGFSVSAWVRLTNDTASRTVVSQQGATNSAFRLGYDSGQRRWTFSVAESDTATAAKTAVSTAPATQGVWTHLTGTFDDRSREVRLYVDGALQRQIALLGATAGFNAGGQVWIGKALRNSAAVEPWQGDLAEVRAWSRTITPNESLMLADPELNRSDVGWWRFNDGSGDTAVDSSPYGRDLTLNLAGGARWGEAGPKDLGGTSLELNGASSFASTTDAVLNTDQSFSVDVWAKVNGTGTPRAVVVQHGPSSVDPFALRYDGSQWSAEMPNSPIAPSTWWRAKAAATAGTWTHLVATYDANARTLKLSVGTKDTPVALKSTVTGVTGWNSTGVLSVGRGSAGEYFNGNIDDLRVWQGALAPAPLGSVTRKGSSISGDRNDEIISVQSDGIVGAHLNVNGEYPGGLQHIGSGWSNDRTWFADIDGDGKSEIVGVESDGRIKAFKNVNGMNGFPYVDQIFIGSAPGETKRIRFADIDGDGRDDRVSLDDDGRVRVYRNLFGMNELGQSTAFSTTPVIVKVTGAVPEAIRFADIDGDGRAEFITVNPDERTTVWAHRNLSGLGYGTYDTPQEIGSGWTSDRTFFADITGDGKAEIIAVYPDSSVWSYTNHNGLTSFPYDVPNRVGLGWTDPSRVFFS